MNTEKAKMIMKHIYYYDNTGRLKPNDVDEIFNCLEDGEKYKKIVEEMNEAILPGASHNIPEEMLGNPDIGQIEIVRCLFKRIQENYFPKFKKTVTIEVEAENFNDVTAGIEDILELVDNMGCPKMKIIKIEKEE